MIIGGICLFWAGRIADGCAADGRAGNGLIADDWGTDGCPTVGSGTDGRGTDGHRFVNGWLMCGRRFWCDADECNADECDADGRYANCATFGLTGCWDSGNGDWLNVIGKLGELSCPEIIIPKFDGFDVSIA